MSDSDRVSVILVVRNGEAFIAEALESVYLSTVQPLEVLVIDGGSSDRSAAIAGRFPKVRVVPQRSLGVTNAYNEGIAEARGELIAFISHDDRWLPGKLDRQVACLREHPELCYCVTHVHFAPQPGATIPAGFRNELLEGPIPAAIMETLLARRACFDLVGLLDPAAEVASDTDWFARARDRGVPMAILPETLVFKRIHGSNTSLSEPGLNRMLLRTLRSSVARKRSPPAA